MGMSTFIRKMISFPLISEFLSRGITCYVWAKHKQARRRISLSGLMKYCFAKPSFLEARKYFLYTRSDDVFDFYQIKGFKELFNYPKSLSTLDLAYLIYEHFYERGWHYYEIPQTNIEQGDIIIDCGAAEGLFAFKNQRRAGHVYLFEPLSVFVESLRFLFKNSGNVSIFEEAVSDKEEMVYLKPNSVGSICQRECCGKDCLQVKASTIDAHFYEKGIKIDYLKVDVEGFEENVISGALKTIRRDKPKMALATYHQGQDHRRILEIILAQVPEYHFLEKGIGGKNGSPVILHMWVDKKS